MVADKDLGESGSQWPRRLARLLFTLGPLAVITYAVRARTLQDFVAYTPPIAVSLAAIAIAVGLLAWGNAKPRPSRREVISIVLIVGLMLVFVTIFYYSLGVLTKDQYLWLRDQWRAVPRERLARIAAAAALLIAGTVLFVVRWRLRSTYGVTEVLVGVFIGTQRFAVATSTSIPISSDLVLAMLTASIYLVVRGLDNIHQGATKEPLDPLLQSILRRLSLVGAGVKS